MCLERDKGLTHSCVPECQACYAFTLNNLRLIAEEGASVNLGALVDLVPIADQGCNFCKFLLQIAILSGKVGVARVSILIVSSDAVYSHGPQTPTLKSRLWNRMTAIQVCDPVRLIKYDSILRIRSTLDCRLVAIRYKTSIGTRLILVFIQ